MNHSLHSIVEQAKKLRPTATVVRRGNGIIQVERGDLLSAEEKRKRVAQAKATPFRKGKIYEYGDGRSWVESIISDSPLLAEHHEMSIRVATFNVWFSEHCWEARFHALFELLVRQEHVQIICLQEVTPRFLKKLLEFDIIRTQYRVSDNGNCASIGRYGVAMLVDKSLPPPSLGWVTLPTDMGRSALLVHWQKQVCIATVHLESLNSQCCRSLQLKTIHDELKFFDTAILAGDFNITATGPWSNQKEHDSVSHLLSGFEDLWVRENGSDGDVEASPKHSLGVTFDGRVNSMAKDVSTPDVARYDRVMVLEHQEGVCALDIRIVGKDPIEPDLFISDHFGLTFDLVASSSNVPQHHSTSRVSFKEGL
eukprot:CAMPEP_0194067724 /NCGR_PEP_ID=MMETSP0009_2-20130614/86706_1 /TAXON_ID=210454 /ORGANISM="Grammatophora oceanica, Strain CCMP 410" /LENGTH=366 /DNA_ID=CAMNT_0038720761 /DNA_START=2308 /DNA_END=3408 /DNA_ORIENTATION=-